MTDLVLVTGISGFLGGHVARELLAQGYAVRGSLRNLARAPEVKAALERSGVDTTRLEFVALDLLSDAGWKEAMDGVRYLQHVASPFVIQAPKDRNELIRPAVEGTSRALKAALEAGVERIVLTSSVAAIVYGHTDYSRAFTVDDWTDVTSPNVTAYPESKLRAEKEAWAIADSFGAREKLAVINPGAIMGPILDNDPGTSGELMQRLLGGTLPAMPKITFSIADVRDVAAIQVAAMTAPTAGGNRHIVADTEMSIPEMVAALRQHLAAAEARGLPRFTLPGWVVHIVALFDRQMRGNATEWSNVRRVDGSSGRNLLGRPMIPAADAVIALARSLIDRGLAGPKKG